MTADCITGNINPPEIEENSTAEKWFQTIL